MEEKDMLSIKIIRKKLNQNSYNSFKEFKVDFEKMVHDIVKYRKKEEPEIEKEGKELLKYFSDISKPKPAKSDGKDDHINSNQKHIKSIVHNSETIQIGDFVHVINENDNKYPLILQIFDMWIDEDNITRIHGIWFLIPEQTVYPASKRFLENEVFRTTHYETYTLDKIIDKCYVLFLKDYCRGFPKGSYKELEDSDLILHKTPLTLKRFVLITPENSDIPVRVPYTPEGNITLKRGAGGLDLSKFDTSILDANKNNSNDLSKSQSQTSTSASNSQLLDRKRLNSTDDVNSPYKRRATPDRMMYQNNNSNSNSIQSPLVNGKVPVNYYNQQIQQNPNIPINPYQNPNNPNNNNMRMPSNQINYPYVSNQAGYPNNQPMNTFKNNSMNNSNNYISSFPNNNNAKPIDHKKNIEDIKKKLKHSLFLSSPPNVELSEHLKLYHSDKYLEFIKNRKERKEKNREVVFRLDDLYNKINNGNNTIGKILQLSGRLDMMNVQLNSRKSDSFEEDIEEEDEESESSESETESEDEEEKEYNMYDEEEEEEEEGDDDSDEDESDDSDEEKDKKKKNEIVDDVFGVTDFSFLDEIKQQQQK
ncbi:hypothetical protein PIROE2DRAFT_58428 [Piromyces sp. E2]|nr:hypothetical protein PIROE2DRAFT_58428 [Piromyces sp. E2]|eukprot:OUM67929.1 hypothetical protein PIROE2DRAFT_58428 [Piromyces sp. E2]